MTKVKICGNTNPEDALLAAQLGADYLGLIFAESKRRVAKGKASEIIQALPGFKNFVGVFMNQPKPEVEAMVKDLGIKILQFHGDETALYCQYFMDKGYQVIKTFRIKDEMTLKRLDDYDTTAFLFDTFSKEEGGGTGKPFDWHLIEQKPYIQEKLFLAGGLNVKNLADAIKQIKPYAVDVASGVEKAPGIKDPELLRQFISIAKEGMSHNAKTDTIRA